jgi:very-short-patch-repair endonuclease
MSQTSIETEKPGTMAVIDNNLPAYISFARELRKYQTPEEKILWTQLRGRKFLGLKFLRQHPIIVYKIDNTISFYIADFYCDEKKLVVEIDGLIHNKQIDYDKARDFIMKKMELQVLRVTDEEVNRNVFAVLKKIKGLLKQ